jgi:acyl-CoA thioesterase I
MLVLMSTGCGGATDEVAIPVSGETGTTVDARSVLLFLGDSLTAGYYLDPQDAYPALIQRMIDVHGGGWRVVNAGVSGDTTANGLTRLNWLLRQPIDVLVLALGANDALRGQPIPHIAENLDQILTRTREAYPDVTLVLAGMRMPTNYGVDYTTSFEQLFADLSEKHAAVLIPFLLEGVAGDPSLNLSDGIHPTEAGHEIIARTVWTYLEPVLR